jgi:hypothetical protein
MDYKNSIRIPRGSAVNLNELRMPPPMKRRPRFANDFQQSQEVMDSPCYALYAKYMTCMKFSVNEGTDSEKCNQIKDMLLLCHENVRLTKIPKTHKPTDNFHLLRMAQIAGLVHKSNLGQR